MRNMGAKPKPTEDEPAFMDPVTLHAQGHKVVARVKEHIGRILTDTSTAPIRSSQRKMLAPRSLAGRRGMCSPTASQSRDGAHIHSSAYRNPDQLQESSVVVVGAGNSGVQIAAELAATRLTCSSGVRRSRFVQVQPRITLAVFPAHNAALMT